MLAQVPHLPLYTTLGCCSLVASDLKDSELAEKALRCVLKLYPPTSCRICKIILTAPSLYKFYFYLNLTSLKQSYYLSLAKRQLQHKVLGSRCKVSISLTVIKKK